MNALTVRDKATNKIVACGPAGCGYDPSFNPTTQTKQVEPDYASLIAQHAADLAAQRPDIVAALDNASTVAQLRAAVKQALGL